MQQTHNSLSENIRVHSVELLNKHCVADCSEHVFAISSALAAFGQSAREAVGLATSYADLDTADLFTEVSRSVDRQLWLVESHRAPK